MFSKPKDDSKLPKTTPPPPPDPINLKVLLLNITPTPQVRERQFNIVSGCDKIGKHVKGKKFTKEQIPKVRKLLNEYKIFYCRMYYEVLFQKYTIGELDPKSEYYFTPARYNRLEELKEVNMLMNPRTERRPSLYLFIKYLELSSMIGDIVPKEEKNFDQRKGIVNLIAKVPTTYFDEKSIATLREHFDAFLSKLMWKYHNVVGPKDVQKEINPFVKFRLETQNQVSIEMKKVLRPPKPPIYDLFEASHMFLAFETILNPVQMLGVVPTYIKDYTPQTQIEKILSDQIWMLSKISSGKIIDKIQFAIYNLVAFPLIRESYISGKTSSDNQHTYLLDTLKTTINRRLVPQNALSTYQSSLHDFISENMHHLERGNLKFLEESVYKQIIPIFYMTILDAVFRDQCQYSHWLQGNVVPLEAMLRYPEDVERFTAVAPLVVQIQPYQLHVLFRKRAYFHESPFILIEYYFKLLLENNKRIPVPTTIIDSIPWSLIWRKNMRSHIDLVAMASTPCQNPEKALVYDGNKRKMFENLKNGIVEDDPEDEEFNQQKKRYLDECYGNLDDREESDLKRKKQDEDELNEDEFLKKQIDSIRTKSFRDIMRNTEPQKPTEKEKTKPVVNQPTVKKVKTKTVDTPKPTVPTKSPVVVIESPKPELIIEDIPAEEEEYNNYDELFDDIPEEYY